jgi:voltage-gated sodium channel
VSESNFCQRLLKRNWFQRGVLGLILLSAVIIGLETDAELMRRWGLWLVSIDRAVLALFVVELLVRLGAHWPRPLRFFAEPWNVFDFLIVAVCLMPFHAEYAAVLRLARVLRVLRLISAVPRLQILVSALLRSVPSMGYVAGLLLLLFYVFGVLGVGLFRAADSEHFGSLGMALLSLFQIVTLEGWVDLMKTQLEAGVPPWVVVPYFVCFILIGTMVMLNLLIGVIINGMEEARQETAEARDQAEHPEETAEGELCRRLAEARAQAAALAELLARLEQRSQR